jgi:hypothetical protein
MPAGVAPGLPFSVVELKTRKAAMSEGVTEKPVMEKHVTDDLSVRALVGYGRSVSLDVDTGAVYVSLHLEPHQARELAVALMDAAAAAER